MLEINKLKIKKDKQIILDNINLKIEKGDVVCLLGQNGQGKSTLLKAIMGFNNIYDITGSIKYNEKDISNMSIDARTNIGFFYSWQDPVEISGIKQIDFYRIIFQNKYKTTNILELHKKLNNILKEVELGDDFLERYINEGFSGGEKKKNEIAQLLLLDSNLIMLDEIDSGLDFDTTNLIIDIINKQKKDKTIIFISHHIETINKLNPNKVLLLANKTIVKESDITLAKEIFSKGYKRVLSSLGIDNTNKTIGECIGGHFNGNKNN